MGEISGAKPSFLGVPLRNVALTLLTLHTTASIVLLHYSRTMPLVAGNRYLPSSVVLLSEVLKLALSITFALYEVSRKAALSAPATSLFGTLLLDVFTGDSWKVAVPALLYTLANQLIFVAVGNLEVPVFGALSQAKVLVTGVASVVFLGRGLSPKKLLALVGLAVGLGFILSGAKGADGETLAEDSARVFIPRDLDFLGLYPPEPRLRKRSATYEGIAEDELLSVPRLNASMGLVAVAGMALSSGLAGVWFEKILKESVEKSSLWVRNVQLAVYSIIPAMFIGVVFLDGEKIATGGFFQGWNVWVWIVVVFQAIGGLLVALTIFYADNVSKDFARGVSVVGAMLAGLWLFGFESSGNFLLGTTIILAATYVYTTSSHAHSHDSHRPPPIRIHNYEKTSVRSGDTTSPQDFSIRLPTTPLIKEELGRTTSRPGSPNGFSEGGKRHHARVGSERGYFGKQA